MVDQLELPLTRPKAPNPSVGDLEAFLRSKGWLSAEQIEARTGWSDRKIRKLASQSDYIISSPGIEGYKHLLDATADEYASYRNSRRSQARVMVAKVIRTDRIYYRRAAVELSAL